MTANTQTPAVSSAELVARLRYHVEGQTSTEGPRWQIWDGEQHFARFRNIANDADAHRICAELNAQATELSRMREALGWFVADERFQVAVGGNPNVVERMIAEARDLYERLSPATIGEA